MIQPTDTILLHQQFRSIATYNGQVYLAPFVGTSIFRMDSLKNLVSIAFTDDINYYIRNFKITPFAIYFNNGKTIDKFYLTTGTMETVYTSDDITTFVVRKSDELVLTDKQKNCIDFLDFYNRITYQITEIKAQDLAWFRNRLYVLTRNSIIIYDQFGNPIEKLRLKYHLRQIRVDSTSLLFFSPHTKYLYRFDKKNWHRINLEHKISDVTLLNEKLIILDDKGSTLYIYNK